MKKIFEEDSYIKDFTTKINQVDEANKIIQLEETAFYAKSGGQPGDTGKLEIEGQEIIVLDTIKEESKIFHLVEDIKNAEKNRRVRGLIDWDKRYKHMKMHSALHLMCSIIPLDVTGGQIGFEKSRLDFNDPEKIINKEEVEEQLNKLINEDHKIKYELIDSKILEDNPELVRTMSVKPPRVDEKIRLVKIGDIDTQPCGGTHVKNTSEIGEIIVQKIENKGKKNRRISISLN